MTSVTRKPMDLHRGDTILIHPDHPDQRGEWVVQSREYAPGDLVSIHYQTTDSIGVFVVDPVADLTVRPEPRMAVVHGLRQLATWLEAHPDVPVSNYPYVYGHVDTGTPPGARRAEVDRIAAVIGGLAVYRRGHYTTSKSFGPVTYQAVSCLPDAPATSKES